MQPQQTVAHEARRERKPSNIHTKWRQFHPQSDKHNRHTWHNSSQKHEMEIRTRGEEFISIRPPTSPYRSKRKLKTLQKIKEAIEDL